MVTEESSTPIAGANLEVTTSGHDITEKDYYIMINEAREQFNCLSGRLMQAIEMLGLEEKQERAFKPYIKAQIYERFKDLSDVMRMFSNTPYKSDGVVSLGDEDQIN